MLPLTRNAGRKLSRRVRRLCLEALEDRTVPTADLATVEAKPGAAPEFSADIVTYTLAPYVSID
jgi:hypothetical protein